MDSDARDAITIVIHDSYAKRNAIFAHSILVLYFGVVICLTKKAEPPPIRDVNRDSGTASANGGWLRRLVRRQHIYNKMKSLAVHPPHSLDIHWVCDANSNLPINSRGVNKPDLARGVTIPHVLNPLKMSICVRGQLLKTL
jgi:hypothetical protein